MLQGIRDRAQGLIAGVIVLFLCLTFALWGIQQFLSEGGNVVVAEINGDEVELAEYQRMLTQLRQQAQNLLQGAFDPDEWNQESTRLGVLDRLVDERVLLQAAAESGIRISDFQLAQNIQSIEAFQDPENAKFSNAVYEQRLRTLGMSTEGFQQQLRRDLTLQQLQNGIGTSAFATATDAVRIERLLQQQRDVGFATVPAAPFRIAAVVTEADVQAYFDGNQSEFQIPETVELEYLELSVANLKADIPVDEAALRAYYDKNADTYRVAEQRHVHHILLSVAPDVTPEQEAEVKARAAGLAERVRNGESFAAVATEASDDVGSVEKGGDLGFFARGAMVPEFEAAAFALQPGAISDPVRTEFGFHILQVDEIEPATGKSFDEARAEVEDGYRSEQAEALYYERAEEFSNLVYENPDTLEVAAEAAGLTVLKTAPMSFQDLVMQFGQQVADAAFAPEVLSEGKNSDPIETSDGTSYALRVVGHQPSGVKALADVRAAIDETLRDKYAAEQAKAEGDKLIERLRGGEPVTDVVAGANVKWSTFAGVQRNSIDVDRTVVTAAFSERLDAGAIERYFGIALDNGDYAVVRVSNIREPTETELQQESLNATRLAVSRAQAQQEWSYFVQGLKAAADIKTYPERL